jgi:broad specificity phosphatase PhoE
MKTVLYVVRHGETYENRQKVFQGVSDTKLTPLGIEQADKLGEFFKSVPIETAYVSPLSRARDTMKGVLKYHPEITPVIREKLHEIKGGELTGLPLIVCNEKFDHIMETFQTCPSAFAPPGGESIPQVYARFTAEIKAIAEENIGKTFVIVSHGTAIQTWLSYVKGLDAEHVKFDFLPNGSFCRFELYFDADGKLDQIITDYTGRLPE